MFSDSQADFKRRFEEGALKLRIGGAGRYGEIGFAVLVDEVGWS